MAKETAPAAEGKVQVNRREFLNLAWLASLGFLTVNVAGITYLFAMPRFEEGEFGGLYTVGSASELPDVNAAPQNHPKVKLWISNTDKGVTALYKVCTHLGCLYNWSDQDEIFACPCHGSQFSLDGEFIQGPAPRSLDRFVLRAVDPETNQVLAQAEIVEPLQLPDNPNAVIQVDTGLRIQGQAHA